MRVFICRNGFALLCGLAVCSASGVNEGPMGGIHLLRNAQRGHIAHLSDEAAMAGVQTVLRCCNDL